VTTGTLCLLLLAIVTCWEATGLAAEWSLVPSLSTKAYYTDNLFLTQLPHDSTYGYWISPGAEFSGKTERFELSGRAAMDFVELYGGEPSRYTNIFLPLTMKYRTAQDEWGVTGGFTRDNTLMGELLATGLVIRFTQRNLWTVNPTWTHMITEKFGFQTAFQFNDASYQDGGRLGLLDYQAYGGSAGVLYKVTEQDDVQLSATYNNFRTASAPIGLQADYPGAMLSFTHAFTEGFKANVYGGPRFVSSSMQFGGFNQSASDTIWVYGASLVQRLERATLQLNLTRDIFPSGFGLLLQTDRIGASASYNISEQLTASLDVSRYTVSGVTRQARGGALEEQRLIYVSPRLAWHFSDWWKAEASYSYRWRDADSFNEPVMANMLLFMLTYFPPKLAISN